MRAAAKAFHFEIAVPGVYRIAQRGRRLRRSLKTEHPLIPRRDGEPVGYLACGFIQNTVGSFAPFGLTGPPNSGGRHRSAHASRRDYGRTSPP
jgi:hypothetical protein